MDRFTIRRNLLRGSLSAPLVLTVSSAGAARTTFSACFFNSSEESAPNLREAGDSWGDWGDTWYRVEIPGKVETITDNDTRVTTTKYYIQYPSAYLNGTNLWYHAELTSAGIFVLNQPLQATDVPPSGDNVKDIDVAALALLDPTDSTGTARDIAFLDGSSGTITTKSCHASVF